MRFNPLTLNHVAASRQSAAPIAPEVSRAVPIGPSGTDLVIKAGIHTKRQCPIWTVQLTTRVESKEFSRINRLARAGGGYWSSFGPVADHGFIFFDAAKATAFATLIGTVATRIPSPPSGGEGQGEGATPISSCGESLKEAVAAVAIAQPMPAWRARLLRRPLSL